MQSALIAFPDSLLLFVKWSQISNFDFFLTNTCEATYPATLIGGVGAMGLELLDAGLLVYPMLDI